MTRSQLTVALSLLALLAMPSTASAAWGDLDADFGNGGKLTVSGLGSPVAVRIQPDRKFLVATTATEVSNSDGRIARFSAQGTLDPTFGDNGIVKLGGVQDLELLDDGRMAVIQGETVLTMLNRDGTTDQSFGSAGHLTYSGGQKGFQLGSLAIQDGIKLLVSVGTAGWNSAPAVMRLDGRGELDLTFGVDGYARVATGYGFRGPAGSAIASSIDGGILLGLDQTNPFVA